MVDVVFTINGDNLEDLPIGRHWHVVVGLRNIRLPDNQFLHGVFQLELLEVMTEGMKAVKNSPLDGFRANHAIKGTFAGTKVVNETELV